MGCGADVRDVRSGLELLSSSRDSSLIWILESRLLEAREVRDVREDFSSRFKGPIESRPLNSTRNMRPT